MRMYKGRIPRGSTTTSLIGPNGISQRMTFTRASSGFYRQPSGIWAEVGNNVPRVQSEGLLIEDQRTNLLSSPRGEGIVPGGFNSAGIPTGWSLTGGTGGGNGIAVATDNVILSGLPGLRLTLNGIATATYNASVEFIGRSVAPAAVPSAYRSSAFFWRAQGVGANLIEYRSRLLSTTAGGGSLSTGEVIQPMPLSANAIRVDNSGTLSADVTTERASNGFRLVVPTGADLQNVTVDVAAPDFEDAPYMSSPKMPPPGGAPAQATRAADFASLITPQLGAGTLVFTYTPFAVATGTVQNVIALNNGTNSERMSLRIRAATATYEFLTVSGGGSTGAVTTGAAANTPIKFGISWDASGVSVSMAGVVSPRGNVRPAGLNTLLLARSLLSSPAVDAPGFYKDMTLYSNKLSDAQLAALTA